MTDTEIITEIAKMEGWQKQTREDIFWNASFGRYAYPEELPDYLNSRDAIVPLIEKQNPMCKHTIAMQFAESYLQIQSILTATPRQLCIALLKATGKHKE